MEPQIEMGRHAARSLGLSSAFQALKPGAPTDGCFKGQVKGRRMVFGGPGTLKLASQAMRERPLSHLVVPVRSVKGSQAVHCQTPPKRF